MSLVCGLVTCRANTTLACVNAENPAAAYCQCIMPAFYGPTCADNVMTDAPGSYYAMVILTLVLMLVLFILGVILLIFYFRKFRPLQPKISIVNPQSIAIGFTVLAAFDRLIWVSQLFLFWR